MIRHTVVFRLKHPEESTEEKKFLADAKKILARIPGVEKFEPLRQISPKNDYRFGFSMEFSGQAAYSGYNDHPDHVAFVRDRWLPEVAAFLEIDYVPLESNALLSQHFSAIAAAGPIVGPILAGAMFGWVRVRGRSLRASIYMHAGFNSVYFLAAVTQQYFTSGTSK